MLSETQCTNLTAPLNGALACYQGNFGKECLMACQASWDVPAYTDGRFTCPNHVGIWTPSIVPDCTGGCQASERLLLTAINLHNKGGVARSFLATK